jgi:hypothetical protein
MKLEDTAFVIPSRMPGRGHSLSTPCSPAVGQRSRQRSPRQAGVETL